MPKPDIHQIEDPQFTETFSILDQLMTKIHADIWLSESIKGDAKKIIETLKYIKINLKYIYYCIENKNDDTIYKFAEDKEKGILRGPSHISFHLNSYNDPKKGTADLEDYVKEFERIAQHLLSQACSTIDFISITSQLEWEGVIGCLEARTARMMPTAYYIMKHKTIPLEAINFVFCQLYTTNVACHSATYGEALDAFITLFKLDTSYKEIILNDLDEMLDLQPNSRISAEKPTLDTYLQHTLRIVMGKTGTMLQMHFPIEKEKQAVAFVKWLKEQSSLQPLNIHKAQALREQYNNDTLIVVRLSIEQALALKLKPLDYPKATVLHRAPNTSSSNNNNNAQYTDPGDDNVSGCYLH